MTALEFLDRMIDTHPFGIFVAFFCVLMIVEKVALAFANRP